MPNPRIPSFGAPFPQTKYSKRARSFLLPFIYILSGENENEPLAEFFYFSSRRTGTGSAFFSLPNRKAMSRLVCISNKMPDAAGSRSAAARPRTRGKPRVTGLLRLRFFSAEKHGIGKIHHRSGQTKQKIQMYSRYTREMRHVGGQSN